MLQMRTSFLGSDEPGGFGMLRWGVPRGADGNVACSSGRTVGIDAHSQLALCIDAFFW